VVKAAPTGLRTAPIFTQLVNFCWSLCKWCLFLAIAGAVAVFGYLYVRIDDEIRRQVERRLADFYHDFDVRVGSARFDSDRGISISNLTITQKASDGSTQPVLGIEEMYLAGKLRIDQLVTDQLQIEEVAVRGAKLRLVHLTNGEWNARALLPLPHFGKCSPKVKIEDASATIEDAAHPTAKPWAINDVNMQLTPVQPEAGSTEDPKRFLVEATTTSLPAKDALVKGEIGTKDGKLDLTMTATGLEISPEMLASLPGSSPAQMHGVEFSGRANLAVRLTRAATGAPIGWSGALRLDRGRIAHSMLPDVLTDVAIVGHADPNHLVVEKFSGKCGSASVAVAFDRAGWSSNAPLGLAANVVGFTVDERFRAGLPESYGRIFDRFKPKGLVNAELKLSYDGEKWVPLFTADCRGITLTDAEKFPYTLEQTTGRVEYHPAQKGSPDRLRLDLTGIGGGRPVKVEVDLTHLAHGDPEGVTTGTGVAVDEKAADGTLHSAGYRGRYIREDSDAQHPVGYIKVSGTDVPIHEQLLAALPDKAQELTRSLRAEGLVDFEFRCEWKDLANPHPVVTQDVRLKDCRIKFDHFPYPLQHVTGLATAKDWHWKLENIEGRGANDSTLVKCHGEANPVPGGCDVELFIDGQDVPLDDTLKVALPPTGQQAWNDLQPQGRVDFSAHARKPANQVEPIIEIGLRPRGKTVSLEPRMFPYRLEQVDGTVAYQHGRVDCQKMVAMHDRTVYSAESGVWQAAPDGSWQFGLTNVTADRFAISRDLLNALPPGLQSTIERLQPSGTFALHHSNLSVAKSPDNPGFSAAWDMNLVCQQAAIQSSTPMRGISGEVRIVGRSDGRTAVSAGELAIDSLICKDVQLTNIRGPLWSDSSQLLLGEPACKQQNQPPRRLTADAYGGSLATNIELQRGDIPSYKIDCRLGGVSLARFASERLGGPTDMSGAVSGALIVSGSGQTFQTLQGAGNLHVVDGHIYQLPPLVSMLKLLSNRAPDTTAFNRCDMKFAIQGENVHFEQINLLGDAVSFYGNGEAHFNHKLDLTFYTLIGPTEFSLWKTIASHVSQQSWQLKVVGTFEHPETEKKAVPAVHDMLDHIQSELQDGAATMSPNTASRPAHGATR
jgi:hypothetical protein